MFETLLACAIALHHHNSSWNLFTTSPNIKAATHDWRYSCLITYKGREGSFCIDTPIGDVSKNVRVKLSCNTDGTKAPAKLHGLLVPEMNAENLLQHTLLPRFMSVGAVLRIVSILEAKGFILPTTIWWCCAMTITSTRRGLQISADLQTDQHLPHKGGTICLTSDECGSEVWRLLGRLRFPTKPMPPSYHEATRDALRQVIGRTIFDLERRPHGSAFCKDHQQSRIVLSQFETRIGTNKWLTKADDPKISPHLDAAIAKILLQDIKLDDAKDKVKLDDQSVWRYSRGTLYDIALPDIGLIKHGRSSQRMASGQLQRDNRFRKEVSLRQTVTWKENCGMSNVQFHASLDKLSLAHKAMERLKLVIHHNDRVKLKCNGDQKCETEHTELLDCFLTASLKTTEMVRRLYDENLYGDLELIRSRTPRGEIEVPLSDRFLARLCFSTQQSEAYDSPRLEAAEDTPRLEAADHTPRLEAAEDSGCRLLSRLGVPGYYYSRPTVPNELDINEIGTLLSIRRDFVAERGGKSYLETSPGTSFDPVVKQEHENPVTADEGSERYEVSHIYNFVVKPDRKVCCDVKWQGWDEETEESFDDLKQDCPKMVSECLLQCLRTNNVPKLKFYLALLEQVRGGQDNGDSDVKMEDAED